MFRKLILLPICFLLSYLPSYSQKVKTEGDTNNVTLYNGIRYLQEEMVKISSINLPSLDDFLDAAERNPGIIAAGDQLKASEYALRIQKNLWLRFISGFGNYSYGRTNSLITYSETGIPLSDNYTTNSQSYYIVGGRIGFTLEDIFNYGNLVRQKKMEVKQNENFRKNNLIELRQQIEMAYMKIRPEMVLLQQNFEALQLSMSSYEALKVDFISGNADQSELYEQKERIVKMTGEFINTLLEIKKNLYILQELTSIKLL
ncbi:MAG: TolC family protein [Bacteroidales bacterium]|jgi:outer membrane protein TolC|nr:TolC family protein [Bacteroidales bacterium]